MPEYAITSGGAKSLDDYARTTARLGAKFDLPPYITDGNVIDKKIQEARIKKARLAALIKQHEDRDPSNPHVAKALLMQKTRQTTQMLCKAAGVQSGVPSQATVQFSEPDDQERLAGLHQRLVEGHVSQESPGIPAELTVDMLERCTNEHLRKSAMSDDISSWIEKVGGRVTIEKAVATQQAVAPLLERVGGTAGVDRLLAMIEQHGGLDIMKERLDKAEVALDGLSFGDAQRLTPLLDTHGVAGLENKVADAEHLKTKAMAADKAKPTMDLVRPGEEKQVQALLSTYGVPEQDALELAKRNI